MEWFIFALGSAIFASLSAVLIKKTLFKEHTTEFSATFALFVVLLSLVLIPWVKFNLQPYAFLIIIISASLAALAFLLTIKCLRHMEISEVSPIRNFGPAFLAIFAFFILGEKLTILQISGIITIILGSYFLELDPKKKDFLYPLKVIYRSKYIHLILLSLILYAFSSLTGKHALNFVSPITFVFFSQIIIAILLFLLLDIKFDGIKGIKHGFKNFGPLIALAAILTITYRVLQLQAMSMAFVSLVIPIKRLSNLFSTLIGGEVFKEKYLKERIISCIIMVVGAILIVLG